MFALRYWIKHVQQREDPSPACKPALRAIECSAASVSAGTLPSGPVAAAKRLAHASAFTCVTQPATTLASVAKLAIVGVWVLLNPS